MAVLFALLTIVATAAGGLVALRNRDRLHLVLGFTAGVMLGLVAFDLLPELFELSDAQVAGVPTVMLAFAAGFLVLHVVERAVAMHGAHEHEYGHHHHPGVGVASAGALATHLFLDGVGIGLAFQVSNTVGVTVAIAIIAHDFADGLNTVSVMVTTGNNLRRTLLMLGLASLAPALGAASTLLFTLPEGVLVIYLGFLTGFLLYLATSGILPEAHARHPSRLTLLFTVGGMGLMWFVVAVSAH